MTRKEFNFDFNEDADPVQELHRLRVAATKHFKTMDNVLEYLRFVPTAEEFLAKTDAVAVRKREPKASTTRTAKNDRNSGKPRKSAKRLSSI